MPFWKPHFQMPFTDRNLCIFIQISVKFIPKDPIDDTSAMIITLSGNGLVPCRGEAITWTIADTVH